MALLCVALCGTLLNILMVQNYCNFRVFVFDVYTTLSPHSMVKFYINRKQDRHGNGLWSRKMLLIRTDVMKSYLMIWL